MLQDRQEEWSTLLRLFGVLAPSGGTVRLDVEGSKQVEHGAHVKGKHELDPFGITVARTTKDTEQGLGQNGQELCQNETKICIFNLHKVSIIMVLR